MMQITLWQKKKTNTTQDIKRQIIMRKGGEEILEDEAKIGTR